jgi:uncharacterized protein (TIGR02757 family)
VRPNAGRLKRHLDDFLERFSPAEHVGMDPVRFVRRYDDPEDREVVGFIAAAFAYGNVRVVLGSVERILVAIGPHPARFVRAFQPRARTRLVPRFQHRWNDSRDLDVLLWILGRLLESHGSLEDAMVGGNDTDSASRSATARTAAAAHKNRLDRFASRALAFGHERFYPSRDLDLRRGVRYFFPRPADRSACKRLNLFLRWMVRADDGVDCGVWPSVSPGDLIIPLDTHIARIARYIGLTSLNTPGWAMASDVTRSLSRLDPLDPLRYDFALCHLGIAGDCPRRRDLVKCAGCPIRAICRL